MAAIGEPFSLSSYSISQKKHAQSGVAIYSSYEKPSGSGDGHVTVAVQADGVHVLDVATLHPVISHTLGPSTVFSCPPLTLISPSSANDACTTYAAIEGSSEIKPEDSGRIIWRWTDSLARALAQAPQEKLSVVMPHPVAAILKPEETERLLTLSPAGAITLCDTDLQVKSSRNVPTEGSELLHAWEFPSSDCQFIPMASGSQTIVVLALVIADSVHVQVLSITVEDELKLLGECDHPFKREDIAAIACSSSGCLSIVEFTGLWHAFQLSLPAASSSSTASLTSTPLSSFQLQNLAFLSSKSTVSTSKQPSSSPSSSNPPIALLALTSSHVLLAGLTVGPSPEIALLVWDLQYTVLLAAQLIPVPSGVAPALVTASHTSPVCLSLTGSCLSKTTNKHAILTLSPHLKSISGKTGEPKKPRSTVLVVPYSVPSASTLRNALGRASAGERWILAENENVESTASPYESSKIKLMAAMRTAITQNRPQAASVLFFEWERQASAPTNDKTPSDAPDATTDTSSTAPGSPILGFAFVKDLLNMLLTPIAASNAPYSPDVVRRLLTRRAVSSGMLDGGLLACLRGKNDWESIELAIETVVDLTENELIETLSVVVVHHLTSSTSQGSNDMQVDTVVNSPIPTLPTFLALVLSCTTSTTPLRLAMRAHLRGSEELVSVLKVLDGWVGQGTGKLLPSKKELVMTEDGVLVQKEKSKKKDKEKAKKVPPLNKVIPFLETLLDASFPTLIANPTAQRLLRHLQTQLLPEVAFIEQTEQLRVPLGAFASAHAKAIREAKESKEGVKPPPDKQDWRQKRRLAQEQVGMAVGVYQLEELVL